MALTKIPNNENSRMVYFVMEDQQTRGGGYVLLVAVENKRGYYRTSITHGGPLKSAREFCDKLNAEMGYSKEDALAIRASTMPRATAALMRENESER